MKAVIFDGVGSVKLADAPKPDLQTSKDALIKLTHTSICGSDLNILAGKIKVGKDKIIGHEGVGVVEKVGSDVKRIKPGDRVVVPVSVHCGECTNCQKGRINFCEHFGMFGHQPGWGDLPGTQAEYMRIPYADVVLERVPPGVSEEQAIFVGDNLITGYMGCENGSLSPGDVVVVFGAGPVGLCAVAAARLFGPSLIISVDLLDYRLEAAKRLGADVTINSSQTDAAKEIKKIAQGQGADVAIEAVGSPETLNGCLESVRGGSDLDFGSVSLYEGGNFHQGFPAPKPADEGSHNQRCEYGASDVVDPTWQVGYDPTHHTPNAVEQRGGGLPVVTFTIGQGAKNNSIPLIDSKMWEQGESKKYRF